MRKYEVMIIIDPTVEERQVDSLMEKYLKVITDEKGTVDNVDVWGKRRLAYDIQKKSEGIYVVVNATCEPATSRSWIVFSPSTRRLCALRSCVPRSTEDRGSHKSVCPVSQAIHGRLSRVNGTLEPLIANY
ncbi:SSU ribosomal protein S6p [Cutibacterium acnes JCM 18916]|nr:SSU ribosomal protein S6p [Cutibacterium acnes JCM 18916]